MKTVIKEGSIWRHKNGNLYKVLFITNEHTERPEIYPVIVVYKGANGNVWSRPLSEWPRSFAEVV